MPRSASNSSPRLIRRRTLLHLAGSATAVPVVCLLPEKWHRPVVSSVLLPAHAQSTVTPVTTPPPVPACTAEFRLPGVFEFTVPSNATNLAVTLSGAGGGGGGSREDDAGNGGAGELVSTTIVVTPGDVLSVVVGAGGAGGGKYDLPVTVRDGGFGGDGGGASSVGSVVASGGGGGSGQGALPTDGGSGAGPLGGAGGVAVDLIPPVAVFEGRPGADGGVGGGQQGGMGGPGAGFPAPVGADGTAGQDGYVLIACLTARVDQTV